MLHSPSSLYQHQNLFDSLTLLPHLSYWLNGYSTSYWKYTKLQKISTKLKHSCSQSKYSFEILRNSAEQWNVQFKDERCKTCESNVVLDVQTLRDFPSEKLCGELVMVRFDSMLLKQLDIHSTLANRALSTIRYIYNAGAKLIIVSNWETCGSTLLSAETVAGYLSSILQVRVLPANGDSGFMRFKSEQSHMADILFSENLTNFKEELANCPVFSEKLLCGAGIFINDAFSLSHKILASTVGATRFCYARLAGFHFEEELLQLKKIREITTQPYIVIIGGSKFQEKADALHLLASVCDGLIFVGMLVFQIMDALGLPVPSFCLERDAVGDASRLLQLVRSRNIPIYFPADLQCINDDNPEWFEIFPSTRIPNGWTPIDLGPSSLKEIYNFLLKCKKVLWIGPVKFGSSAKNAHGSYELAMILGRIGESGCDITVVGNAASKAVLEANNYLPKLKTFKSASVVWQFLKGKSLPGVAALDRAYPYNIDWSAIYKDPAQPLVVDIGSGNGLFAFRMAKNWKHTNFLGLEINNKLVRRCLDGILEHNSKNVHFIATNATSTFRSIVASYPGKLTLVSIQCPNPDFNHDDHRWRMVQRALVEAIIDLLAMDGKVFLQSDIESVTMRMKDEFMKHAKGMLILDHGDGNMKRWLSENPFRVPSDWEQHVVDRGDPIYRIMLRKICIKF